MTRGEQEAVFDKVSEQVEIAIGRQELRAELTNVKEKVQQQQDIINRLVLFSMSFHIFRPLAEILRVPIFEDFRLMPPSWFLRFGTGQAGLG
jgi:hypothetical protein